MGSERHTFEVIIRLLETVRSGTNNPSRMIIATKMSNRQFYHHMRFCLEKNLLVLESSSSGRNQIQVKTYGLTEKGQLLLQSVEKRVYSP